MIVFPGERFRSNVLEGFEEAAFGRSVNGWMDSELFLTWLREVFIPGIHERRVRRPILLFVDGHSTHLTLEVSDLCREHDIHMFCLLEHASHIIQPLDLRVFGVLKENWDQAVRDYQIQNVPNTVNKKTFAQVFKVAWDKSTTVENAVKAFKYAGIYPLDESVVVKTTKMEPSKNFKKHSTDKSITSKANTVHVALQTSLTEPHIEKNETSASDAAENAEKVEATVREIQLEAITSQPHENATPTKQSSVSGLDQAASDPPVASPFSRHLSLPSAPSSAKTNKKMRQLFPKAITGEAFRKILTERKEQRENLLREKQKRKEDRERKRKERQEENLRKKKQREENLQKRKEEKQRKLREKELKKKLLEMTKRKRTETSSSDSSINYEPKDDSDVEMNVNSRACFKCGTAYDDNEPLKWIACDRCPRLFHRNCTDVPFDEMDEEETAMYPFECLYC